MKLPASTLELLKRLGEHRDRLARLRARLRALGTDYEHRAAGGHVYYAVDWSELFCFLTGEVGNVDVGFNWDPKERDRRVRLGLAHLFSTFTGTLYLLPPHAYEMWSFVRVDSERIAELHARAQHAIEDLAPADQSVLELLATSDEAVPQEALDRLVELIKGEFEEICDRVTTFIASFERDLRGRLRQLVQDRKLAYIIEPLFESLGLPASAVKSPSEEVDDVTQQIHGKKPFARRIDARALLQLRSINQRLARRGAYMVLVTRDQNLRNAAEKLAGKSWFGWPEARRHFRHVETIYLDLALRGTSSQVEAHRWIVELDDRLGKLEESVSELLKQPEETTLSSSFAADASRLLDEAKRTWDEHVNLRLSLAEANIPWLQSVSIAGSGQLSSDANPTDVSRRKITLIKKLWEFVKTDKFKEVARSSADQTWLELHDEALQVVLLSHLGKQGTSNVVRALAGRREDGKTVLHSTKYFLVCSLQFVSKTYQRLLANLRHWDDKDTKRSQKLREAFLEVVRAATTDVREAEGFLFMAFLLGTLNLWSEARILAERSLNLPGEKRVCEIEYFLAVASRKLAAADDRQNLREYVVAYEHIMRAIEKKLHETGQDGTQDPRYLKERGTIVLAYHEAKAISHDPTGDDSPMKDAPHPSKVTEKKAVDFLSQSLGYIKDDRPLRIDVLNNLAYEAIRHANSDLDTAERYVTKLNKELELARENKDPSLPHRPWPDVRDTQLLVAAHRARQQMDIAMLQHCADELAAISDEDDLLPGDKKLIQLHADQVRSWHSEAFAAHDG